MEGTFNSRSVLPVASGSEKEVALGPKGVGGGSEAGLNLSSARNIGSQIKGKCAYGLPGCLSRAALHCVGLAASVKQVGSRFLPAGWWTSLLLIWPSPIHPWFLPDQGDRPGSLLRSCSSDFPPLKPGLARAEPVNSLHPPKETPRPQVQDGCSLSLGWAPSSQPAVSQGVGCQQGVPITCFLGDCCSCPLGGWHAQ